MFQLQTKNLLARIKSNKIINNANNAVRSIESKIRGTRMENWLKYWKNLFIDYKEVIKETRKDIIERPIKASCYITGLIFLGYCSKHNPDENNFRHKFIKASNDIILVNSTQQKSSTVHHLRHIEQCYNRHEIRRLNLIFFSFLWTDKYSNNCNTYESVCSHMKIRYLDFNKSIIDVGFLDRWWLLNKVMEDYDVNY